MSTNAQVPGNSGKKSDPEPFQGHTMSISLTVKDLEKSIAWYHDVVGFGIERKIERDGKLRGVVLIAGDGRITINQDDGAKGWERVKGEGFSIQVTTDQNVDEIAKGIKERGGNFETEPADMRWGARLFRLKDPDGFKLSISSVVVRRP